MAVFEIEGPDGQIYEVDAPDEQSAVAAFRQFSTSGQGTPQERGLSEVLYDNIVGDPSDGVTSYGESLGTWLNRAGESMTLGLVGDEASAMMTGALTGRSYDSELERYRQNEENMSGLGRTSADIFGALVPGFGMAGAVAKAPTLTGAAIRGAGLGAGAGAVQGFMEGEGGAGNRLASAGTGVAVGGGIGAATPALGALLQSGLRAGKDMVSRARISGQGAQALGISPQATRVLSESLQMENPADMAAALSRAGPDAMLAEAAPGLQGQLDAAMRSPGRAARIAGERINARAEGAGSALRAQLEKSLMGNTLQPPAGRRFSDTATLQGDVRQATAGARSAVYDAAYAAPIDYSGKAGRDLEGLIPRIPAAVWRDANRLMQLDGDVSKQIMAQVAEDGSVRLQRLPDVRQWDYVKRALDQAAASGEGQGALGGQTPLGRAYQGLARNIRGALGDAVPEYDYATSVAARAIDEVQAIKTGAEMLRPGVTRAEVEASLDGASKQEIAAVKRGLRQYIDDTLANVGAVASDQNVDAREAQKALAMLSSQASRDKLGLLLGEQAAPIFREIEKASSALGLRARTASNSQTAGRLAAEQMMNDAIDPSLLRQGKPIAAAKEAVATALGGSREAVNRLRGDAKADLADVLTRPGAAQILQTMQGIAGRNTVDPQTGSTLRKLFEAYMLGGAGRNAEKINSGISARILPARPTAQ